MVHSSKIDDLLDKVPKGGFPSLKVAGIELDSPVMLAPLAGYSSPPFRQLCARYGAALVFSEMCSISGLFYGNRKGKRYLHLEKDERPAGVQLFGSRPEHVPRAMSIAAEFKPDLVDLNMGCPQRKVIKTGAGGALMQDLVVTKRIVEAMVEADVAPVTVKMRNGPTPDNINVAEVARNCVDAGAKMVTVHGRVVSQMFKGDADRAPIAATVKEIDGQVPVVGNGDINDPFTAVRMMVETGCQGIMIGRAAVGRPWIFEDIVRVIKDPVRELPGWIEKRGDPDRIRKVILEHGELLRDHFTQMQVAGYVMPASDPELMAMKEMRAFLPNYLNELSFPKEKRGQIHKVCSLQDLEDLVAEPGN